MTKAMAGKKVVFAARSGKNCEVKKLFLLLLVVFFIFPACHQRPLNEANLKLLEGKATKEEIKVLFGTPDSIAESQGETIYLYVIPHKEKAESWEYNSASGQRQLTSKTLHQWDEVFLMLFDKRGILRYWSVEKI